MDVVDFVCQKECVSSLKQYAALDKHSIVIEGCDGSGKTYLAKRYARMLDVPDVVCVDSKVNSIKSAFDQFLQVSNKVCIVIENLDSGVPACAYVLLKFMEEPSDNLYVVVTCKSKQGIPNTILSRSMTCRVNAPVFNDMSMYASKKHNVKVSDSLLWKCASNFNDVDEICSLGSEKRKYISKWSDIKKFNAPVNSLCWQLGHYEDGTEITSNIVVKYIMTSNCGSRHVVTCCKACMDALDSNRIARYLALAKLAFDLKYCE